MMIYIGNTRSVSISFLFLFFFHQSSLYPIKIFAKCFYLLVIIIGAKRTNNKNCLVEFLRTMTKFCFRAVALLFGAITALVIILLVNKREGNTTGLEALAKRPLGDSDYHLGATIDATPLDSETTLLGPASAEDAASAADGHQNPKVIMI